MQRILLIDNYDSFTFNLAHYFIGLGVSVDVVRNDHPEILVDNFDRIVLSPGPGLPSQAGRMPEIIESWAGKKPILGVCLGMQGIAEYLGGNLYNLKEVKHGVQETVRLLKDPLFENMPEKIKVGLYHSWAVKPDSGDFAGTAFSENDVLMALNNQERKLFGVQFHPESIMTEHGKQILKNFLLV